MTLVRPTGAVAFSCRLTALLLVPVYQEYYPEEVRWPIQGYLPADL
jgi:hypothetical protein